VTFGAFWVSEGSRDLSGETSNPYGLAGTMSMGGVLIRGIRYISGVFILGTIRV
jgi:hypothetical protein